MIRITNAAQEHFAKLLLSQKPGTQIRIFVTNPGTPNAECCISYCFPDKVKITDTKIKFDKLSAYIDDISIHYLQDAEIDFVTDKLESQLILKAPNASTCVARDDRQLFKQIENWLQSNVNPHLASHGGQVNLIKITDNMIVVLQFSGGCNGCSMINYTLKEWIEKELLEKFHEIKGVRDLTEHQHGEHSYS